MKKKYEDLYERKEDEGQALKRLEKIVKILREKCPWDKAQTHGSLKACMIEEAYEAVEAIENNDFINLREELGDVLLQVVFHSVLSENEGKFIISDVINDECDKMIRRHPHIFLEENAKTIDKVLEKWENMKSQEHDVKSVTENMQSVPKVFPALLRGYKVQSKASQAGFDWDDVSGAFEKVCEEFEELKQAYANSDTASIKEEMGDLLFSVINVSRFLNINPEEACNESTEKFIRRFDFIEKVSEQKGLKIKSLSLAEMDMLWEEAKKYK